MLISVYDINNNNDIRSVFINYDSDNKFIMVVVMLVIVLVGKILMPCQRL